MNWDFAAILLVLVVVSGAIWAYDALILAPGRAKAKDEEGKEIPEPKIVDFSRSFFPIFLIVLLLRSFLVEPFRIPSGSMMPTLLIGDFILVNKFTYGIRLPVLNTKVIQAGSPKRGDIVVFRFPEDPSIPFIKRIVGLPGDRVAYYEKILYINGKPMKQESLGTYTDSGSGRSMNGALMRREYLDDLEHSILLRSAARSVEGESEIPQGHYFVLGDNRDNSRDSRFWGTVPDENLIGKAFFIWMNLDWDNGSVGWDRIGNSID